MNTHFLKTWTKYFQAIIAGAKTFELRKNDRDYAVGDTLVLEEYDPETQDYTGHEVDVVVTSLYTPDDLPSGLENGYCIMEIQVIGSRE